MRNVVVCLLLAIASSNERWCCVSGFSSHHLLSSQRVSLSGGRRSSVADTQPWRSSPHYSSVRVVQLSAKAEETHPEFSVEESENPVDDMNGSEEEKKSGTTRQMDGLVTTTATEIRYTKPQEEEEEEEELDGPQMTFRTSTSSSSSSTKPEYGALAPGTVVQVQIGDLSLARKAWKKRRRTGSPLLVPCSVLNVDRQSMVRWNLIHLLEKFGNAQKDGIAVTEAELSKHYRSFLKSSLSQQTESLGYESNNDLIRALFDKKVQDSYGIRLVEDEESLSLRAPISRHKAHKRASRAPLLQFRSPRKGDDDYSDGEGPATADTLTHTGFIRSRGSDTSTTATTIASTDGELEEEQVPKPKTKRRPHQFLPLSAALRVSQKDDVDTGRIEEGSIHAAVVFDYDIAGDGGSPLLTLSLNPGGVRESLKIKPDRKYIPIEHPKHMLDQLAVGDGPYNAKVVRLVPGKALIDCEVGRKVSTDGGMVKVLGSLRFQDAVEINESTSQKDSLFSTKMMMMSASDDEDGMDDIIEGAINDLEDWDDIDDDDDDDDDDAGLVEDLLALRKNAPFEEGTFEEDEEEEDISDSFQMNGDGTLVYTDPETGEKTVVMGSSSDDEEEDEEDEVETASLDDDDDDDAVDDITDLLEVNADGSLSYIDPETDEAVEFDEEDEEFADMMMVKNIMEEHMPSSPPAAAKGFQKQPTAAVSPVAATPSPSFPRTDKKKSTKWLRVGDDVQVYIRSVSKQSSQFTVTTSPDVQGRTAKDLKKNDDAQKRLERLEKKLGGSLERIWALEGKECTGTVRATSQSGDWLYVQPDLQGLPVGVATYLQEGGSAEAASLAAGDSVRVRISGIDEQRGQLSMQVLDKLAP